MHLLPQTIGQDQWERTCTAFRLRNGRQAERRRRQKQEARSCAGFLLLRDLFGRIRRRCRRQPRSSPCKTIFLRPVIHRLGRAGAPRTPPSAARESAAREHSAARECRHSRTNLNLFVSPLQVGMRVKTPPVASREQARLNAERTKNHLAANIRTSLNAEQRTAEQKENEQRTYQPPTDYQLTTDY